MPSNDGVAATEADDFLAYVTTAFPDTASHWVGYDSESEFVDIMTQEGYSRDPTDDRPAFAAGIVFTSGSPAWEYTVSVDNTGSGGGGGAHGYCAVRFHGCSLFFRFHRVHECLLLLCFFTVAGFLHILFLGWCGTRIIDLRHSHEKEGWWWARTISSTLPRPKSIRLCTTRNSWRYS